MQLSNGETLFLKMGRNIHIFIVAHIHLSIVKDIRCNCVFTAVGHLLHEEESTKTMSHDDICHVTYTQREDSTVTCDMYTYLFSCFHVLSIEEYLSYRFL